MHTELPALLDSGAHNRHDIVSGVRRPVRKRRTGAQTVVEGGDLRWVGLGGFPEEVMSEWLPGGTQGVSHLDVHPAK